MKIMKNQLYTNVAKDNRWLWMICLKLNWFFYSLSSMLHLSEFVWTLRSSVLVVLNNFLLIDATDRSKISNDQKRFFFRIKPIPLSFLANTPFKWHLIYTIISSIPWKGLNNVNFLLCICSSGSSIDNSRDCSRENHVLFDFFSGRVVAGLIQFWTNF